MSKDKRISEINERLRDLKENYHVDLANPKGVGLGDKAYFATNKKLSMSAHEYHTLSFPFENGHILEMVIEHNPNSRLMTDIGFDITYPSNIGLHLTHLPSKYEENNGKMSIPLHYAYRGSDKSLHDALEHYAKEPSKALKMPEVDSWENHSGRLVTGEAAQPIHKAFRENKVNFTGHLRDTKPNELKISYPEQHLIYNLVTEELGEEYNYE